MEKLKALELIKNVLPEKRYIHTLGVLETAVALAEKYGANQKKVELAAIFHDYAKYRPVAEMKSIVSEQNMSDNLLKYARELLHAPVGAYLVRKELGIDDEEVLDAIRYHTTGRPFMTLLEKIIYISDYIEPNRSFSGVDEVRLLAQTNLDEALLKGISNTIYFLVSKQQPVFPDTLAAYNHLILKEEF